MNGHDTTFLCWTRPLVYTKSGLNGLKSAGNLGLILLPTNGRTSKDHLCETRVYTPRSGRSTRSGPVRQDIASLNGSRPSLPSELRQNLPVLITDLNLLKQIRPI